MTIRLHFHDVPTSDFVRGECEQFAADLQQEFPEASKFEISMTHTGEEKELHLHITGRDLEVAAKAHGRDLRETLRDAFVRVRKQLRKHHDKQIFSRRRAAQKPRG